MSSSCTRCSLSALVLCLGGCGGGGGNATPQDAAPDTPPGMCGAEATLSGEMIDWDSTEAAFCGVAGAVWTVRGDASRKETTPPNGRLAMCLAHQAQTVLDVTPSGASQCPGLSGMAMNTYPLAAVAILPDAVLAAGATFSVRAMVQSRMASMATQIGVPFDPAAGQLYVHVDGPAHAVLISADHAAPQSFDGTHWVAGDTGSDVFFPNVAVGAVTVSVVGGAIGTGSFTLEAGKMTYLTVVPPSPFVQ
ncbi:MAG TPA: hypothetical protein VHT91_10980 [Kofleriaceae bacterium]|jgi:hypothetical protein|nr:hypothetical protein [Kofleriaceae bacterium]